MPSLADTKITAANEKVRNAHIHSLDRPSTKEKEKSVPVKEWNVYPAGVFSLVPGERLKRSVRSHVGNQLGTGRESQENKSFNPVPREKTRRQ